MNKESIERGRLSLHHKILVGMILGIPFGLLIRKLPFMMEHLDWIKLPGDIFLNLIVMLVVPLVFASILAGTASLGDIRKLGRIGGRTLAFYLCTTSIAIIIGLFLVNIVKPGTYVTEEDRANLQSKYENEVKEKERVADEKPSELELLKGIVPTNPFLSLGGAVKAEDGTIRSGNTMLQIIFFSLLMGVGVTLVKKKHQKPVLDFFESITEIMIALVNLVMHMAPIGVFSLMAAVLARLGLEFLGVLLIYALTVIAGLILHALITYHFVMRVLAKRSFFAFIKKIQSVLLVAFSTSSSGATLPVSMQCAEEDLGVENEIASFVLPLGVTINMDGTALYQAVAAVFIAQVFGMDLTLTSQLTIVLTATLASIGTAGVPAVGIIMLIIVLKSINVPVEGIALILGVDRLLDMLRTTLNVTGDLTASVFVNSLEENVEK